jgi:hypothetical protein
VDTLAASGPAWQVLAVVLTVSVTEELLFRAYPIASGTPHGCPMAGEHYSRWLPSLRSTCGDGTWGMSWVSCCPWAPVMTGLYLWRRNVVFVIITILA